MEERTVAFTGLGSLILEIDEGDAGRIKVAFDFNDKELSSTFLKYILANCEDDIPTGRIIQEGTDD